MTTNLRTRTLALEAKVEVLVNYWAKMMFEMQMKAGVFKDKKVMDLNS